MENYVEVHVLENDQISQWVEQEGRLDHDQNLLPDILKHIKPGDTVIDAGAFIGDHTIAYSDAVGQHGLVLAYEPNPISFQCLKHNVGDRYNVVYFETALGDTPGEIPLSGNNGNAGGCYAGEHMKIADVPVRTLDHQMGDTPVHFIKIDVEGYELKVLRGAEKTIESCHPTMVIEINQEALRRQNATPDQIFGWLTQHCYGWRIIEENALRNDPLYNIIALPHGSTLHNVQGDEAGRSIPSENLPGSVQAAGFPLQTMDAVPHMQEQDKPRLEAEKRVGQAAEVRPEAKSARAGATGSSERKDNQAGDLRGVQESVSGKRTRGPSPGLQPTTPGEMAVPTVPLDAPRLTDTSNLPAVDTPGPAQVSERINVSASMLTPSPQVPLTPDGIKAYVKRLKDFAMENAKHKSIVSQHLVHAQLRKPNKKTRRKRKRAT